MTPSHPSQTRNAAGFTLLEVLLVLILSVGLLAWAAPVVYRSLPGVELQTASLQLAADLRQLRLSAIRSAQPKRFVLDVEARHYRLSDDTQAIRLPTTVHIQFITGASFMDSPERGAIVFYPDGSSTGGQVVLARDGQRHAVEVNWVTGMIQVKRHA